MVSENQPNKPDLREPPLAVAPALPRFESLGSSLARAKIEDPPVVVFQQDFNDPVELLWTRMYASLSEPAYGAQRVFDLFTLMAITLAFGLLFGAMKALDAIPEVFFGVTTFVTFVGIGQMLLFGGKSPRLASVVGGPIALSLTIVLLAGWYGQGAMCGAVCAFIPGIPAGYLAGGMVAGVFLIADSLRDQFSRPAEESEKNFWEDDE